MGLAKQNQMEIEDKLNVAIEVAYKANVLAKCEMHGIFYDGCDKEEIEAYKLGNHLITTSDPLVDIFKGNRNELTDLLKDIRANYPDYCCECERKGEY